MENINTKQKIMESALKLFSVKGFDDVSIDEIGKEVGIKGPSIYRYFRCKEEIFEQIYEKITNQYLDYLNKAIDLNHLPETLEEYCEHGVYFFEYAINNQEMVMNRKVLTLEQFQNKNIARFYNKHQIDLLIEKHSIALKKYMELGLIKKGDENTLAFELVAPFSLLIEMVDRDEKCKEKAKDYLKNHFAYFIQNNKVQ